MTGKFSAREDTPGQSPPKVSGRREKNFFDVDAAAHERAMRQLELGKVCGFIGGPATVATFAALLVIIACVIAAVVSAWHNASDEKIEQIWAHMFDASFGLAGTALGFLFGRGNSRNDRF